MSDSKRIEWKTFWAITPATTNAVMTSLTHTGIIDNWAAALIAGGGTVVAGVISFTAVDTSPMWNGISGRKRSAINRWLVAGVSTHSAAMQYAIWSLDGTAASLLASWATAAGTGVLAFAGAKFADWRLAAMSDNEPKKSDSPTVITVEKPDPTSDEIKLAGALTKIGVDTMIVRDSYSLRDGAGKIFVLRVTSSAGPKFKPDSGLAEQIAITLRENGYPNIQSDLVRFSRRPKARAGEWELTILERDVMAETIPYVDDPTPTSIKTPSRAGITMSGDEIRESLRQHTRTVGQSTQGKSGLIHVDIAHISRCHDALLWIGGTWKLYDLVDEWLEPYEDTGIKPPIDWVVHTQQGLLEMLAAAIRYAKYRLSMPKSQRHWRDIIIIIDEVSFAVISKEVNKQKIFVDDATGWCNVAQLIGELNRASAQAGIFVHLASQKGTQDQYGEDGANVVANSTLVRMFASRDWLEMGRQLNDYDLHQPEHPGEYWMLGKSGDRKHLKAHYIQSSDPSKPRLHDGQTISDISWARRDIHRPGLSDDEGAAVLGDAYANRSQLVDREWMTAIMTGADPITAASDEKIAAAVEEIATEQTEKSEADSSIPVPEKRSDKIELILQASTGQDPMDLETIRYFLGKFGDDTNEDVVSATLTRMKKQGLVRAVNRGHYVLA